MTPGKIRVQVALERVAWIRAMLDALRRLPSSDLTAFLEDERTAAAAESYLRRAIEGLLDLGRHILAKGFGEGLVEYKEIAAGLADRGIVSPGHRAALVAIAGYRNRLTHFYDEVKVEELHEIVTTHLDEIEAILNEVLAWLRNHPDLIDRSL
ncbi:MAG: DUF86 domain-containing protein [Acidobacteria bacterium]|nr:MAG: DUF86 domain-containing protein [Acidobacteriota bacterium]